MRRMIDEQNNAKVNENKQARKNNMDTCFSLGSVEARNKKSNLPAWRQCISLSSLPTTIITHFTANTKTYPRAAHKARYAHLGCVCPV